MSGAHLVQVPAGPWVRWGELAQEFIDAKRSAHTRAAYRVDLASWLRFCIGNEVDALDAWPRHVMAWLAFLADSGEAGTTQARRLAAVSSWYVWLIQHEFASRNPALLTREARPVRAARPAPALSDEHTSLLLAAADRDPNPRSRAIVWTLFYTGVRVGELIDGDTDHLGMTAGHTVWHVHGKGGKLRTLGLVPPAIHALHTYWASRDDLDRLPVPSHAAGAGTGRPMITTRSGRRIERKDVRRLLQRLARQAGLPPALAQTLTPHSTRATYATTTMRDSPLREVQLVLGHASPTTTIGYDRAALDHDRNPSYTLLRRWDPRRGQGGHS